MLPYCIYLSFFDTAAIQTNLAARGHRESYARMVSLVVWKCVPKLKTQTMSVFLLLINYYLFLARVLCEVDTCFLIDFGPLNL